LTVGLWYQKFMESQAVMVEKKPGRPATGQGTQISLRLQEPLLKAVDRERRREPDLPGRPEMIRRLLERATAKGK
jgi:hypothetical protein